MSHTCASSCTLEDFQTGRESSEQAKASCFVLQSPSGISRNENCRNFNLVVLSKPTWCGGCQRTRPCKAWTCVCNTPWYTCKSHGTPPASTAKRGSAKDRPRNYFKCEVEGERAFCRLDDPTQNPRFTQACAPSARNRLRLSIGKTPVDRPMGTRIAARVSSRSFACLHRHQRNTKSRILSYRIISYFISLNRHVSYCMKSYHIVSSCIIEYRIVMYHVVLYCIVSHCIML